MVAQTTEPGWGLSPRRDRLVNVNPVKVVTVTRTKVIGAIENIPSQCVTATTDKNHLLPFAQVSLQLSIGKGRVDLVLDVKASPALKLDS
jgi:hypothetical protein